jgi:uncharacterized OsmC-like protein
MTNEPINPPVEPPVVGPRPLIRAEIQSRGKQLKEGRVNNFTVMCDESERIGGTGSAPAPLHYFFLSVGFCMLTQVTRNAELMAIELNGVTASIAGRLARSGAIEEGTAHHGVESVEIELRIDSDAPKEQIAELARRSEDMCFVSQAIRNPVETTLLVQHNSQPLPLD